LTVTIGNQTIALCIDARLSSDVTHSLSVAKKILYKCIFLFNWEFPSLWEIHTRNIYEVSIAFSFNCKRRR